ncbi:response regulator [Lutibacter sp.]|uniref:response regulator n=1 Tax=Lutibacter sp. TaxID=1925666 RepID=UPI001A1B8751|nr:response regulator [Lutibacter sp.]MBI9041441.1 response regulator [Lutibacter sp.]
MTPLNNILLIDDDSTTNLLNEIHIQNLGITNKITILDSAVKALDLIFEQNVHSDLIFLDLNMPVMNGWQFLEEYCARCKGQKSKIIILTASINPSDKEKAVNDSCVLDFVSKPLNKDKIMNLMATYENSLLNS